MTYNMLYTYPDTHIGISLALHYVHKDDQRIYFHFELNNQTESKFEFSANATFSLCRSEPLEFCSEFSWWESMPNSERRPLENPVSCGGINTGFCMALPAELATDPITIEPSLQCFHGDYCVFLDFDSIEVSLNDELRLATTTASSRYEDMPYNAFSIDTRNHSALYHDNGVYISKPSYSDDGGMESFLFHVENNAQCHIAIVFELLSVNGEDGDLEREIKHFVTGEENGLFIADGMECSPMSATEFVYSISVVNTESKEIIMVLQASTEVDLRRFSIETKIKRLLG